MASDEPRKKNPTRPMVEHIIATAISTLQNDVPLWVELLNLRAYVQSVEAERDQLATKHDVACQTIRTMQHDREERRADQVLADLASWLGHGSGATTSPGDAEQRIREGVDTLIRVETRRRAQVEAERDQLRQERDEARREIEVDNKLLAERQRILDAEPCPQHGPSCVPHVLDVLKNHEREKAEAIAQTWEAAITTLEDYARSHTRDSGAVVTMFRATARINAVRARTRPEAPQETA